MIEIGGSYMKNVINCLTKGYKNLEGTIKAFLKFTIFLIGTFVFTASLMYIVSLGVGVFNSELASVREFIVYFSLVVIGFILLPITSNIYTILLREYVVKGSKIRLKLAISEALQRLNGRFFSYYVRSSSVLIGCLMTSFLCGVTIIGVIFVPIIAYLLVVTVIALAYQGDVYVFQIFKNFLKEIVLISFCLFVVTLVSGLIPILGALIVLPIMIAPQIFVCTNFK